MISRLLLLLAVAGMTASSAQARGYVKASAFLNGPSDLQGDTTAPFDETLKGGAGFGLAFGYRFTILRLEAEFQHFDADAEPNAVAGTLLAGHVETTGSVQETSGFANVWLELPSFLGLSPYLGAGLGVASFKPENLGRTRNGTHFIRWSGSDSVFGYQAMLGLQYRFLDRITVNAGYRAIHREDIVLNDLIANARRNLSFDSRNIFEVGLAVGF